MQNPTRCNTLPRENGSLKIMLVSLEADLSKYRKTAPGGRMVQAIELRVMEVSTALADQKGELDFHASAGRQHRRRDGLHRR